MAARVLITGGAGFIGSHLAAHYQASARVLDNFRTGKPANLLGCRAEIMEGSVLDRAALRRALRGIETVFHLAAMISVEESMREPALCNEINLTGLALTLEEAAAAGVRVFCFSSSAAVYGDNPATPKVEAMPPEPRSPYAISKWAGECLCEIIGQRHGMRVVSLRYFNVFGPRQDPRSPYASAIPSFLDRAQAGQPITIHGDGEQTRDFVHVRDVVAANVFAAEATHVAGVFNVGAGQSVSINRLVEIILHETGSGSAVDHVEARPGDVRHSLADPAKLAAVGWQAGVPFGQAIQEMSREK